MKNSSTGAAWSLAALRAAMAALACLAAGSVQAATTCSFRPNAPDQHVVVKGDTLWDISGAFLEHPWCWPQVWGMNREEIRNPHWIYPGQVVYFDRARGRLTLTRPGATDANAGQAPLVRLSPQLRTENLGADGAVPAIPSGVIEPFLIQPLVVEAHELDKTPRIAAVPDDRVYLAQGDRLYVHGDLNGASAFQVFRPGKELRDPDTGKVLAYEAAYVGDARLTAVAGPGVDVHSFVVSHSVQEMGVGDRLLPTPPTPLRNYVPHLPSRPIAGRIMSMANESNFASRHQVVTVNRGALDGLDVGAVLQLYHHGQVVADPGGRTGFLGINSSTLRLPDEQVGELFIFRVFGHVSYGLVMQSKTALQIGDVAKSPE